MACQNKKDTDLKKKKGYRIKKIGILFSKINYCFKLQQLIYRGADFFTKKENNDR